MNINGFNSIGLTSPFIRSTHTVIGANGLGRTSVKLNLEGRLAGSGMSFERFSELLNSDTPISDKLAEITEAFGNVTDKQALEITIRAIRNGEISMEEIFQRTLSRSAGLTVTKEEAIAAFEAARRASRAHLMTSNNDPEIARKYAPILAKLQAGGTLTAAERSFLREHYPETYAMAVKAEQEVNRVKEAMRNAGSEQEARQILLNAQIFAASGDIENVNLFLVRMLSHVNPNNLDEDGSAVTSINMLDILM